MTTKSSSVSDKNNDDLKVLHISIDSHHTKSSHKRIGLVFCFLACPKRPSHQFVLAIFYSSLLMPAQSSSALSHFAMMLWYHSEDIKICKFRCLKEGNGFAFHFYGYPKWLPYPGKLLLGACSGSGLLQMLSSFSLRTHCWKALGGQWCWQMKGVFQTEYTEMRRCDASG